MRTHAARPLCLVLSVILALSPVAASADSPNPTIPAPSNGKKSRGPLSDYVPCLFSDDEQSDMRTLPPTQKQIDYLTAEQLVDNTKFAISQALSKVQASNRPFVDNFDKYYKEHLKAEDLFGKTLDQANSHIRSIIVDAVEFAETQFYQSFNGGKGNEAATYLQSAVRNAAAGVVNNRPAEEATQSLDPKTAAQLVQAAKDAISNSTTKFSFSKDYVAEIQKSYQLDPSDLEFRQPSDAVNQAERAAKRAADAAAADAVYPFADTSTQDTVTAALASLQTAAGTSADQTIKQAEANQFQPPDDVSCSMAVMSWKETSDIFGRRVANTFVALQVTLRNLNTKNEFLVHDIQVAVDTGVSAEEFGRFQAGRDKLLVRAVAQRGQSEDRRNRVLNILQAAGAIAGASSIATGITEAKDAVAVFQGAFLPGFANIFPDHTVEQLNHINDLVFSASNTSKVLVPVQGSVPLVTFISEKPIEQLPFAWCGHPRKGFLRHPEQNCDFKGGDKHKPGYFTPYRYGKHGGIESGTDYKVGSDKEAMPAGNPASKQKDDVRPWDDLHYKDWKAAALRMLQEHTFVVVGGVHIQEVAKAGKVRNLDCPSLTSGPVDISQTKDGVVTCTVTGEALDKVNSVALEKGTDKIAGKIKAAKDANSATLTFDPAKLSDGDGTYSLFLIDSAGTETDSGESVSLSKQPYIQDLKDSGTLDLTQKSPTLTLEGKHLDLLNDVHLVSDDGGSTSILGVLPTPIGATSVAVTFQAASSGTYHLTYTIKAEPASQKNPNPVLAVKTTGTPPKPENPIVPKAPKKPAVPAKAPAGA
jgi:hypothetical protein